jgi:signal transduction histidine kinase
VLALACVTIAIIAATYFLLNSTWNDLEEQILRDHAQSIASHLELENGHWTLQLPPDLSAIYARGFGGYALAVVSDDKGVIYSSLPNERPFLRAAPQTPAFFHQRRGASVYYGMIMPVTRAGRFALIQVGQNLANSDVIIDDVVTRFLGQIAWLVVPIFIVLLFVDVLLMRRLLGPIIAASHVASAIQPNKPLMRLPTRDLPREVLPLAEAVNQALDRLDKGLRAQREFTADAAHELRTPLAILRTHVDTLLDARTAHALQSDIDTIGHVLGQLLELAELENFTSGWGEKVDLNEIGTEVVTLMAPTALAERKSLEFVGSPHHVWALGNAEMLFRAVRNLVENAIRHSDGKNPIEVEVDLPATIRVKDRGPGIQPAERELMFQRFWRKNRQDKGHSGLGLAIVAKIIQLHGGSVDAVNREGGGAAFSIVLPGVAAGE